MGLGKNKLSPLFQMFVNSSWSLSSHPSHPSFLLHSLQVSKYSFIQGSDLQGREGEGKGMGGGVKNWIHHILRKCQKGILRLYLNKKGKVCWGGGVKFSPILFNFNLKIKYKQSLTYKKKIKINFWLIKGIKFTYLKTYFLNLYQG